MNKTVFNSLFAAATFFLCTSSFTVEARECRGCRNQSNMRVSVGTAYARNDAYVVRRYAHPVAPTVVYADPYGPVFYEPVYPVYSAPAPVYIEEVYVAPRPAFFNGLSFSWNFFR